jgi:hypothetical protein
LRSSLQTNSRTLPTSGLPSLDSSPDANHVARSCKSGLASLGTSAAVFGSPANPAKCWNCSDGTMFLFSPSHRTQCLWVDDGAQQRCLIGSRRGGVRSGDLCGFAIAGHGSAHQSDSAAPSRTPRTRRTGTPHARDSGTRDMIWDSQPNDLRIRSPRNIAPERAGNRCAQVSRRTAMAVDVR